MAADDHQRRLDAARALCEEAYREARRLVYDQVGPGPLDEPSLTPEQRVALERLRQAERHVDEVRRAAYDERHPPTLGDAVTG